MKRSRVLVRELREEKALARHQCAALSGPGRSEFARVAGKLGIDVPGVQLVSKFWLEWRHKPLPVQIKPVDVGKEGMIHDVLGVSQAAAQPSVGILHQKLGEQFTSLAHNQSWEMRLLGHNETEHDLSMCFILDVGVKSPFAHHCRKAAGLSASHT